MSTVVSARPPAPQAGAPAVSPNRLISLDLFRGLTIAAMILVNDPASEEIAYKPLRHAEWNGWTPTDLVFPFFLFIVGVSLVFSFASRMNRGASRKSLLLHTLQRSALIFAIGLALNGLSMLVFPAYLHYLRIPGVLQRIAVAYLFAAILYLYMGPRGRVITVGAILVGYWALLRFIPVPGYGMPGRDVPFMNPEGNLASYLDRLVMGHHLYLPMRDPEGILSTLPAIATVLLGVFTGEWLRSKATAGKKAQGMLVAGGLGLALGEVWNVWFPINKNLWTSSYVLFTAGFALAIFAACYWANDIKQWRGLWTRPFVIFGTNAIAAYIIAWILADAQYAARIHWRGRLWDGHEYIFNRFFAPLASPSFASLLFSITFVLVCLVPVWIMYRKRIFLKV